MAKPRKRKPQRKSSRENELIAKSMMVGEGLATNFVADQPEPLTPKEEQKAADYFASMALAAGLWGYVPAAEEALAAEGLSAQLRAELLDFLNTELEITVV